MAFLALPAVAGIAGIVGAGVSATGAIASGEATKTAAEYQAQIAANNAIIENQNAAYAVEAGQTQAAASSMKNAATLGKIKTSQAANNIDVNTGSEADVQASQRETGDLDAETVLNNAELTAYGYRTQATSDTAQSGLYNLEGETALTGSELSAGGTLLSNASNLGFKWTGAGGANAPFNIT